MTDSKKAIEDASRRNTELLKILSDTDYAPPALDEQKKYIKDLQNEITKTNTELERVGKKRASELKDHEKYQQSVMKRFAYKATGQKDKFQEKASKEEQEYFQVLEEEHKTARLKESLEQKLQEAQTTKANLEPVVKQNNDAQKELDDLYQRVFAGATPDFPEEDAAEQNVKDAQDTYNKAQSKLETAQRVLKVLREGQSCMKEVLDQMGKAHNASSFDMLGGGAMADVMERTALGKAENGVTKLKALLNEAARLEPAVGGIGDMNVASGHIMSDVMFDCIFTDMNMHQKIKDSETELRKADKRLAEEAEAAKKRAGEVDKEKQRAATDLETARKELQRIRAEIMNQSATQ